MYEVAMFFSIVSSVLFCIYLLMCIFGTACRSGQQPTIEIRGRIVTRTVTFANTVDNDLQTYTMPTLIEQVKR